MISVCIASYNGASVILTQLRSILEQLGEGDEVIISDDQSTDDTRSVIASLGDPRVRVVDGPALGTPIPNFERAISLAQGDYIFLSDQDDQWMPGKVTAVLDRLRAGYDCVVTDCIVTDKDLHPIHPSFFALNHTHYGRYYNLLAKNGYLGCCMAFTRQLRDRALPFPASIPMHDMWIGNVAAFFGKLTFIDRPYSNYRRTGDNVSTSGQRSSASLCKRLGYRWHIVYPLVRMALRCRCG